MGITCLKNEEFCPFDFAGIDWLIDWGQKFYTLSARLA